MLKLKITIEEVKINESYFQRIRKEEKEIYEINVYEEETLREYKEYQGESLLEKIGVLGYLVNGEERYIERHGRNMVLCFGCGMPINKEEEGRNFEKVGKIFEGICWECEEEQIQIEKEGCMSGVMDCENEEE